ncbi:uncharacterized protein LOC128575034 isoform X1 [Nycticebus coucang]|uniref:uncharacterized protein LOC128575034 isoform X1 n=1 Tax=Nycticebus coucang TaxID=9470 RepID=UPI00234E064B|nr:uncharacterized protein LOC128575034 isoform X1 [Nycticebus coucang]
MGVGGPSLLSPYLAVPEWGRAVVHVHRPGGDRRGLGAAVLGSCRLWGVTGTAMASPRSRGSFWAPALEAADSAARQEEAALVPGLGWRLWGLLPLRGPPGPGQRPSRRRRRVEQPPGPFPQAAVRPRPEGSQSTCTSWQALNNPTGGLCVPSSQAAIRLVQMIPRLSGAKITGSERCN